LVFLALVVLLWAVVPTFYGRCERHVNARIAERVAEWPFLGSTLRGVLLSLPDVKSCVFAGHAECAPFTNEGSAECFLVLNDGVEARFVFNLLGKDLYPATSRTKELLAMLDTNFRAGLSDFRGVIDIIATAKNTPDNQETRCSPQVLSAKPLNPK
jgi:hypothetical protein